MRKLLEICSGYAADHGITFNASKSKYIAFASHHKLLEDSSPQFYINNTPIERVNCWPHLGNILDESQSDSACINNRRMQMIGQINEVLTTFGKLDCITKVDLLYKYCNIIAIWSVLWNLCNPGISRICSAWRTALKRCWRLPYNTHSDIVTALSSRAPMVDELRRRVVKFHFSCLNSTNEIVRFICMNCMSESRALSPHGRNLLHISNEYGVSFCAFKCLNNMTNIMHAAHIRATCKVEVDSINLLLLCELIMLRDNLAVFQPPDAALSKAEIDMLINNICTE
jgi:hypothetical protein